MESATVQVSVSNGGESSLTTMVDSGLNLEEEVATTVAPSADDTSNKESGNGDGLSTPDEGDPQVEEEGGSNAVAIVVVIFLVAAVVGGLVYYKYFYKSASERLPLTSPSMSSLNSR